MSKIDPEKVIKEIKNFKKRINAEKIIIFGSFARGEFKEDSDIDLILVDKNFRGKKFNEKEHNHSKVSCERGH